MVPNLTTDAAKKKAVQPITVPLLRFSHIHIDLGGLFPASTEGFSYLLTCLLWTDQHAGARWFCSATPPPWAARQLQFLVG
jgi:hypothetical protein